LPLPNRETFSSRIGTVLAAAGVAIGLANIWRFPYMMGTYGGVWFLLTYLAFVLAVGVPVLMCEWALGRSTRQGPVGAFARIGVPGGKPLGWVFVATVGLAAPYYTMIIGWVLLYLVMFATGSIDANSPQDTFDALGESPGTQFAMALICVGLTCGVIRMGVRNGIERLSKWAAPVFFLLFAVLITRAWSMDGAVEGVVTFLSFDNSAFTPQTVMAALGQGLFSLGVGGNLMLLYGSYLRPEEDLPMSALYTAGLDVGAAMMAALLIVPSAMVSGIDMASGPPLAFVVMPEILGSMPAGRLLGAAFFLGIFLMAILTLVSGYELFVRTLREAFGWSFAKALLVTVAAQTLLMLPPALSVTYLKINDLLVGSTLTPLGAAVAVLAIGWWFGRSRTLAELRKNTALPVPTFLFYWIKYVVPVAIVTGLIYGWMA
jgi:neurotransmitter:Na+ symporter, NSS family